ncbi:MAG: YtxH domain-containing protein [Coriobacteriia bacterium]|nr:YtxH domain-containing protein [Coriobacteriia bacterium]
MRERTEYFLMGTVTGLVVGGLLGLLFAPASGAKTRRRIADEAIRAADVARTVAERAEYAAEVITERMDHYLGRDEEAAWRRVKEIREGVGKYTRAQTTE